MNKTNLIGEVEDSSKRGGAPSWPSEELLKHILEPYPKRRKLKHGRKMLREAMEEEWLSGDWTCREALATYMRNQAARYARVMKLEGQTERFMLNPGTFFNPKNGLYAEVDSWSCSSEADAKSARAVIERMNDDGDV